MTPLKFVPDSHFLWIDSQLDEVLYKRILKILIALLVIAGIAIPLLTVQAPERKKD